MTLVLALLLDAAFGEPDWLWSRVTHPAVAIGRGIGWADRRFNHGSFRKAKGVILTLCLLLGGLLAGLVIAQFGWVVEAIVAAILLAQRSLADHVSDVARALRLSVAAGRVSVSRIVGRDTAQMDEPAIVRGAIESGAENLSDAVVAPVFWFLILGLPGLLAYKAINTADSMIGYLTPRHRDFGWAAARLDDLLNWAPARLSALLIPLSLGRLPDWPAIARDARLHRSPNAGWPEAAMAQALDVALSGPRAYDGEMRDFAWVHGSGDRFPTFEAVDRCAAMLWRSWGLLLALACVKALLT